MKRISVRDARIPALGFGTWKLQGSRCAERVADALAVGYRHIDTAEAYDNQEQVGLGLRRSKVAREEVFLTSKVWFENLRRADLLARAETSLKELGTDYLDLLLVHWPNPEIPLGETLAALRELQEKQRLRHIGVSNFPPSWVEAAVEQAPLVCDQVEYHPLLSQQPLLETLRAHDMALVAYSPLAHGKLLENETLQEIARGHDRSPAQVALRWLVSQDRVAAIPKASSREHLEQNFAIFDFELDESEMQRLHALAERKGERTIDPAFAPVWER